jgi:hypothetical protein
MSDKTFTEFSKEWIDQSKGYEYLISIAIGRSLQIYHEIRKTLQYATLRDLDAEWHGYNYIVKMYFNDTRIVSSFLVQSEKMVEAIMLYYHLYIPGFICSSHYDFLNSLDDDEKIFVDNIGKIHPHFYPPTNINATVPHEFDIIIDPSMRDCNLHLRNGKCMQFRHKTISEFIQSIDSLLRLWCKNNDKIPKIAIISNVHEFAFIINNELKLNAQYIYLTNEMNTLKIWLNHNEAYNKMEYYNDLIDGMRNMSINKK